MINPFKLKKWGAMIIASIIPSLFFVLILRLNGLLYAVAAMLVGGLLSVLIGSSLLRNPFTDMLEGKGLLSINLTSTGVMQAFIMRFDKNFTKGYLNGQEVEDYFDRDNLGTINAPVKGKHVVHKLEDGGICFKLDGKELNDTRFAFNQYPVLFFNSMSNTFFSKEQLSALEKKIISYNKLIFLSKKVEDLTISVKNFARHIVDTLRPKKTGGGLPAWVLIVLVVIVIAIIVVMIIKSGGGGAIGGAINTASQAMPTGSGSPIIPR